MAGLSRLELAAASLLKRRSVGLLAPPRRAYGSAAAAQLDYYSDEEEEHQTAVVDSAGWIPRRGIHWVLIGDRGAKKHLYAERLSKLLEVPHISMGTLVRQELNPRSSLYKQIANAVNEGKLVQDEVIFALLSKRLEEGYYRGENGFILDGIPRTRIQAELVDQIAEIDLVVNFKSTDDLVKKNLGTGSLALSQDYLRMSNSMHDVNLQEEQLKSAIAEKSKLLEDYYRKQNKLIDFHMKGAPGETWKGLLAALHLQHINAVSSSQKLTA
ncbi:probable adenylate kinase 7, mitochondrial [Rosa rugosa]|uniref:probable adenylate kinase 7, mitochondrial n=1 Tax=Rosa rugosa TaxID=74645 RepID=UPI002B40097D|nr:probable adenylate kinase 7, mitochondrial [Rosa rugosa]